MRVAGITSLVLAGLLALGAALGCATMGLKSAVHLSLEREKDTPRRALVYIDEQFIGTLDYVAAKGVRLPEGKHRISVQKNGYYPFDALVESDRYPIHLRVALLRLPD